MLKSLRLTPIMKSFCIKNEHMNFTRQPSARIANESCMLGQADSPNRHNEIQIHKTPSCAWSPLQTQRKGMKSTYSRMFQCFVRHIRYGFCCIEPARKGRNCYCMYPNTANSTNH